MEVARSYHFDLSAKSPRVAILKELKVSFGAYLLSRPDIAAVNVAEDEFEAMFLEVVPVPAEPKTKKQYVDYVDLDVLGDGFTFYQFLEAVAKKVVGLDALSIAMVTDLFTDEAGRRALGGTSNHKHE